MMAWLQQWTTGLMATMALTVITAQDSGLPGVERENLGPADIVKKESHPVLFRQKRGWIWNSLYVEEEKPVVTPLKIGRLKSDKSNPGGVFKIEGEGANDIFIVDNKGDLFVTKSLDREKKNAYHLTAMMSDAYGNRIENPGEFVVQVTDINDNTPVFTQSYNGSIEERSRIGRIVVEVKATDADDPTTANAELRYSLTHGDISAFEIDSITGVISCKINTFDRETREEYVVVVKAQDMRGLASGSTATTSVTIKITDINDNIASFTRTKYDLNVPENHKVDETIGILELVDKDEIQNKEPIFTIQNLNSNIFNIEPNHNKDGNLVLKEALDFEKTNSYSFTVRMKENVQTPADNTNAAITSAQVNINVLDVDEPPIFSEDMYSFNVKEEMHVNNIGFIKARDPDRANKTIQFSIMQPDCPIGINRLTGQLYTLRNLDREDKPTHMFQVKAQEEPSGLESVVKVNINVQDVNDNEPELRADDIYICENDESNTIIGTLTATDKDDQPVAFTFSLASENSNFSIRNYGNGTAALIVKQGPFSLDDPKNYKVDIRVSDGGHPSKSSVSTVSVGICQCDPNRNRTYCKPEARRMGVSVHALTAILLCILTILVIVILFAMRKRYQKDSLANMKNSGEIHEQLVTYDEEGGGEMDTNGYDVSILTSACHDGSLLRHQDHRPHPSLYAMVQKPPHHTQPTACKGDMAAMIEVKKDEADHDRDGFPYDTLHIYGYEGPESLAGSLSSLGSSSTGSNLDYDFLNDWGPRFRTLAELYGVDGPDYYHQY
uniref:Cadherin-5 n=1 Tax=Maylandia zebra TaxID=106582 RepID=A0A3P9DQ95_9CICH|nr:cadherin-5 [Maylandia zebra]